MNKQKRNQAGRVFSIAAIFYWCAVLAKTEGIFEAYLLPAAAGLAGCIWKWSSRPEPEEKKDAIAGRLCSGSLSFAVVLANYGLFRRSSGGIYGTVESLGRLVLMLWGGYAAFRGITGWIGWKAKQKAPRQAAPGRHAWLVLPAAWAGILGSYLLFFYGALYPGLVSPDSLYQVTQILSGAYTNHQPFYHTQLIRLGLTLGGEINRGLGVYNLLSILLLSFSFAYAVDTVYRYSGSRLLAGGIFLWYGLSPIHILYSVTVWKNVPFGAVATLFIASTFRIQKKLDRCIWGNLAVYVLSAVGACLLLSNGFIAMAAAWLFMVILFWKENKCLPVVLAAVLCGCFVLKHPVLKAMNVPQADFVESLSIPAQQIARVVVDGKSLTEEEQALLEQVIDLDEIPEYYTEWISDPVKELVRARNNQAYLTAHKWEYLKLYVQLGLKYPAAYIAGWVEQTKGYWNGGYEYMRWVTPEKKFSRQDFGIYRSAKSEAVFQLLEEDIRLQDTPLLKIFLCIGLYSWMLLICLYAAFVRRDRQAGFTAVLPAMLIGTLLISTPVFAEFRYAYGVIASMPVVAAACLCPGKE